MKNKRKFKRKSRRSAETDLFLAYSFNALFTILGLYFLLEVFKVFSTYIVIRSLLISLWLFLGLWFALAPWYYSIFKGRRFMV